MFDIDEDEKDGSVLYHVMCEDDDMHVCLFSKPMVKIRL